MKKIININFHSRVIPIEETAYEILQQYVDSLRRYFANEEGREEIISDIENRFSELFAETLKKGAVCITDADVNAIIASMGRPEEFGEEEGTSTTAHSGPTASTGAGSSTGGTGSATSSAAGGPQQGYGPHTADEPRRLYRAANDKVLGGVCAGLASYLKLDPVVVRILFLLMICTWGFGLLLYIVLWIVLPTKSLTTIARKRLYRNPDDRVIAGVASGIAAYFHIDVWIPRLVFALPLIIGVITSLFQNVWWHVFHFGGHVIFDGFGGSLVVAYIVLWIVLPEAVTASEKLEMRGERIDLESIKNTVKSDMESFNRRAREMGAEMKESFQNMGQNMGNQIRQNVQNFSAEKSYGAGRSARSGIGHAIGVLFKAFFLTIAGLIAFGLIMALVALAFSGGGLLDLKSYVLDGFWENILAWASFLLILVIPVIALLTWLVRRITGMRSRRHYLGYVFSTLWIIGLISFVVLAAMVINNFRSRAHSEEDFALVQPSHGNLVIRARQIAHRDYYDDEDWWFGNGWRNGWRHSGFFYSLNDDSVELNTVQIKVLRSDDSAYHLRILRGSLGSSVNSALDRARRISFPVSQSDSIIQLPGGFSIDREQKFRNQQVIVAVYIPVGKKIMMDNSVSRYDWFNLNVGHSHINLEDGRNDYSDDYDDEGFSLDNNFYWNSGVQYIMTADGLKRVNAMGGYDDRPEHLEKRERPDKPERPEIKEKIEAPEKPAQPGKDGYRYKEPVQKAHADTLVPKSSTMLVTPSRPPLVLFAILNYIKNTLVG